MGKRLSIKEHISVEEMEKRYRGSTDVVERSRWQIIWLLAKGNKSEEVAEVTGYGVQWIRTLARRFNEEGAKALGDARHHNPGAQPLLDDQQQAQLVQALEGIPPGGGRWTGPKVALWMSEVLGRPVAPQRGWEYLKGLEYSIKMPRPAHTQADEREQEEWKKKLPQRVKELEMKLAKTVRLWTMDEHRVGFKPKLRRDWFPWWEIPIAPVYWRFEWFWLYGFVEPSSGESEWWLFDRVETPIMSCILEDFVKAQGIDEEHPALLVLDRAGWHTTEKLEIPPGLFLEFLPAYSPELQPAERLWPVLDEAIINRVFDTLENLKEVVCERCRQLIKQPDILRALTQFHWWPQQATCNI